MAGHSLCNPFIAIIRMQFNVLFTVFFFLFPIFYFNSHRPWPGIPRAFTHSSILDSFDSRASFVSGEMSSLKRQKSGITSF